ncbi:MerR family transcriptional regulator [Kribbella antibiotica]|uniref:MerR family transcriptional regulator n=1 Tax=Kribbella antibiotica TaxID=190195 RepID=A0A4R4Z6I4_9ACTN|nr:MerR family transcriptional regulator [Kribbella antibiotica]TDD53851.1 MerR family transcriptional regulator [Kribbella antibiotica]
MQLDDFMTIGQLAKISGLSMDAIRRYGDDGLLPPASVDPSTRYRRYLSAQGSTAKLIRLLRDAALPLRAIRRILHREDDPLTVLYEHRDRLVEKYDLLRKRIERMR